MTRSISLPDRALLFRILVIMSFALFLVFSHAITAEAAQEMTDISSWSDLQNAVINAESCDTVRLIANVTADETDKPLVIPEGLVLTIDLNGHTIDRNMKQFARNEGTVFSVQSGAVLTVKDSSETAGGRITGGYAADGGGIRNNGTLILENGCITGNTAKDTGGGIVNYGVLIMKGAGVTGNTAGDEGGGIYNSAKGYVIVDNERVYSNTAPKGADVWNKGSMQTLEGETVHYKAVQSVFEMLAVLPVVVLLIVLFITVILDNYLNAGQKKAMIIITILVFTLVVQNYLDTWLYESGKWRLFRTIVTIYGYAVRPAILALFLHILCPDRRFRFVWAAVGLNAALYLTALFSPLTFSFPRGYFISGPFQPVCLIVCALLFLYCIYWTFRIFRPKEKRETWIPFFALLLISLSVVLDETVAYTGTPISFLTAAIAICCMMYYIWLHLQFVREHEKALQAEHRIQIMMTQIQPHFLFNTLNSVMALCNKDTKAAVRTLGLFSVYLRQNLEALDNTELIPLSKELEHTRVYTEIETIRFPNIRVEYDIRDEAFCIPALTIQPLVENAIRHGVRSCTEGVVRVSTCREEHEHLVVIEDNGAGFDREQIAASDGTHIGISNVGERLEQMCGGRMEINSALGKGTRIVLHIPANKELNA